MTLPIVTSRFHYLIGADAVPPDGPGIMYEAPYRTRGKTCYGNLRRELKDGKCKPYLPGDDITEEYGEYCPDPVYPGYLANVKEQIDWVVANGGLRIEFDNPDTAGLKLGYVLKAHDLAWAAGLHTIAKNPMLTSDPARYISHPSIDLVVVERGKYGSDALDTLRKQVNQPLLAVRFVACHNEDGDGLEWANRVAVNIRRRAYHNMGVTYSRDGEYTSARDVQSPYGVS